MTIFCPSRLVVLDRKMSHLVLVHRTSGMGRIDLGMGNIVAQS